MRSVSGTVSTWAHSITVREAPGAGMRAKRLPQAAPVSAAVDVLVDREPEALELAT